MCFVDLEWSIRLLMQHQVSHASHHVTLIVIYNVCMFNILWHGDWCAMLIRVVTPTCEVGNKVTKYPILQIWYSRHSNRPCERLVQLMGASTFKSCFVRTFLNIMATDSWHSCPLTSGSSFIFTDEMNHFRYYLTSSAPCLKGFPNTKL